MQALAEPARWQASLGLRFAERQGETVLVDRRHHGPLRVQRPFYPESRRVCHVYLIHPPGGLVSGDRVDVDVQVDSGAWGLVTTPGASQYYRSDGQHSVTQRQRIQVAERATMEWLPQETILFDGAQADMLTRVDLHAGASFIGWDVTCLGRPASGEYLQQCNIRQRFEVWQNNRPLWLERTRYCSGTDVFSTAWGLRNYTVVGSLICTYSDTSLVEAVRTNVTVEQGALFSVSQLYGGIVCRYLGHHAEQAQTSLQTAWQILRPAVLGEKAVAPRIWKT
jgi:urease accessory protein